MFLTGSERLPPLPLNRILMFATSAVCTVLLIEQMTFWFAWNADAVLALLIFATLPVTLTETFTLLTALIHLISLFFISTNAWLYSKIERVYFRYRIWKLSRQRPDLLAKWGQTTTATPSSAFSPPQTVSPQTTPVPDFIEDEVSIFDDLGFLSESDTSSSGQSSRCGSPVADLPSWMSEWD